MASDPEYNDLKFVEYLGNVGIVEKEKAFRDFLDKHNELSGGKPVSPRVFQGLVDQHFEPVNEARTYITQELNTTWGLYAILTEEQDQQTKEGLKSMGDSGVKARQKYDDLFKRLTNIIIETAPRVNWKKGKKHQQETAKWIDKKHFHFNGLVNDGNNSLMRNELETVRAALAQAQIELPVVPEALIKAKKAMLKTGGAKRPLSDDGGDVSGPAAKKSKQQTSSDPWWGPNKSKLNCSDAFFEIVRQSKAYLANPTDQPGTKEYRLQMTRFLRMALNDIGLRHKLNQLLLMKEFRFRNPGEQVGDSTTLVIPGSTEKDFRLGKAGWHAFNDFKKVMGGGFSPQDLSYKDLEPPPAIAQGLVALAHSQEERSEASLRGGGSSSKVADNYIDKFPFNEDPEDAIKHIDIREGMEHRFRDPTELWKELLEDAKLPKNTWMQRIHENRPPMIEPARIGATTSSRFKDIIKKIALPSEWETVTGETDMGHLDGWAETFDKIVEDARGKVYDFLYLNDTKIDIDAPSLLQVGGKNKPKTRYAKKFTDKNFAKPIGYAFRARTYQVLRYYIAWRYFLMRNGTLSELLEQEKILYQVWDEHEDLYMNWENNKWFELSDPFEIRSLENRYQSRELLRLYWKREIEKIDEALENLKHNASYYDDPVKNEGEGKVIPAAEPVPYVQPPGVAEILAYLQSPTLKARDSKKSKKSKAPTKKASIHEVLDLTGTGTGGKAMDVDEDEDDENMDEGTGDINATSGNASDGMDVDSESDVDPGGSVNVDSSADAATSKTKDTSGALEYLRKTRDIYEKELNETVSKNNRLDPLDIGNRATIHSNNINIMAKNQVIWSLDTEIANLNRAIDPFAEESHGKGAKHKWELPPEDYYYKYTKRIPKQPDVPLGITSLSRGPLPGEHPQPGHPRVFVGACAGFGTDPGYDGDEPELEGGALFGPRPGNTKVNPDGNSGGAATTGKPAGGWNADTEKTARATPW
ncbi:hypothetical protein F4782DRAFT_266435 [Xylaria castorea]|nr:hypothetical protein F4782DRAFT_266435 [Xylaria castorea]